MMKLPRRRFLRLTAGAGAVLAIPKAARAQNYPGRPVRVIVPFPAGGSTDTVARLVGDRLSQRLGQPFVVENRPGAGTNIGTETVVRAPADGYTLLVSTPPSAINVTLYRNLKFEFIRDIAPISTVMRSPFVLVVNPSFPARTVPEFIAYAKINPTKISMASSGIGSGPHLAGELFKMMAHVDMLHVPYRGAAPALTDLLAGQVQVYFPSAPEVIEHIKTGKLRALAVTTTERSDVLPDVPALSDFLPGYEASYWLGFGAPKKTPMEIINLLNANINASLADSAMKARLAALGGMTLGGSPADFGKLIDGETAKWAKVIKFANITASD
jgi:tripartite-type tricarboxylate transporter receptor subunit TctC